jgi:hypothetical protein
MDGSQNWGSRKSFEIIEIVAHKIVDPKIGNPEIVDPKLVDPEIVCH